MARIAYTPHVGDRVQDIKYRTEGFVLAVTETRKPGEWLCLVGRTRAAARGEPVLSPRLLLLERTA